MAFRTLAALLALAVLPACARVGNEPRPGDSLALSVMRAAGYSANTLRDAPGPAPAAFNPRGSALGRGAGELADAGGIAASFAAGALTGGLGLLSVMARPERQPEEAFTRVIAWMPVEMAPTPEAAAQLLVRMSGDAFDRGLQHAGLGGQYRYDAPGVMPPGRLPASERIEDARFVFTSGPCTEQGMFCRVLVGHGMRFPDPVDSPSFVGSGRAYMFRFPNAGGIDLTVEDQRRFQRARRAGYPFLEALVETSRHLPPWAFIYAAPLDVTLRDPASGRVVFLQTPLVLHQGRVLPFVRGFESPVPATPSAARERPAT
jgi:hypothetical protein